MTFTTVYKKNSIGTQGLMVDKNKLKLMKASEKKNGFGC
jgi:hypothetical protein